MKILHTSDWHVGKVLKGQSRADEQVAVLAEIIKIAEGERPDVPTDKGDDADHRERAERDQDAQQQHPQAQTAGLGRRRGRDHPGGVWSRDRLL